MIKKIFFSIILAVVFFAIAPANAKTAAPAAWKPAKPEGYTPITWAKGKGVASFIKVPEYNGAIDFITIIHLPLNRVALIASDTTRYSWGPGSLPFESSTTTQDWAVARMVAEKAKGMHSNAQFIWNVPFFNITVTTTNLSLALKSADAKGRYITTGSRPEKDMAEQRRMLLVNNKTGLAEIKDFDAMEFASTSADQAVEGFAPFRGGTSVATARLYLGVKAKGKELVIYCSNSATSEDASEALVSAGVPFENQFQADGGASATCGYNMPGQYFVEPGRTIPYLMGAFPIHLRGKTTTNQLNVRSGPGTKNKIISKLPMGTDIMATEEKNGWLKIDGGGWIFARYVKKQ